MHCVLAADHSSSDAAAAWARGRGFAKLQYGLITHLRAYSLPPATTQSVCKNARRRQEGTLQYLEMMASEADRLYSEGQSDRYEVDYHVDNYASASGDSGYGGAQCCPLVVDAICLAAILGSIAGASVLIARTMQIEITNVRRKRSLPFTEFVIEGKCAFATYTCHM